MATLRSLIVAAPLLALLVPTSPSAAPKVAVIDVQAAIDATAHGKALQKLLAKRKKRRQSSLERTKADLDARKARLESAAAARNADTERRRNRLAKDLKAYRQDVEQTQKDLMELERKLFDEMFTRMDTVVAELSAERGYDFVFMKRLQDQQKVLYQRPGLDVTDEIIRRYKKKFKGKPIEAPK